MNILWRIHCRILIIYFTITVTLIGFFFVMKRVFRIALSFDVLAFLLFLCPIVVAAIRIYIWLNRDSILAEDDTDLFNRVIFFASIPVEIFFSLTGMFVWFM